MRRALEVFFDHLGACLVLLGGIVCSVEGMRTDEPVLLLGGIAVTVLAAIWVLRGAKGGSLLP